MNNFWLGVIGTLIGSLVTIFGQFVKHQWETCESRKRDENRKELLRNMLKTRVKQVGEI